MTQEYEKLKKIGIKSKTYIKEAENKGMGVFASEDIKAGDVIEYCHCMVLAFRENYHKDPVIYQYAYPGDDEISDEWTNHGRKFLIPLGYGGIYNSSEKEIYANAKFRTYTDDKLIIFTATKDIKTDEEVLVWWSQQYYDYFIKNK
jgi:SET domain-containing protein